MLSPLRRNSCYFNLVYLHLFIFKNLLWLSEVQTHWINVIHVQVRFREPGSVFASLHRQAWHNGTPQPSCAGRFKFFSTQLLTCLIVPIERPRQKCSMGCAEHWPWTSGATGWRGLQWQTGLTTLKMGRCNATKLRSRDLACGTWSVTCCEYNCLSVNKTLKTTSKNVSLEITPKKYLVFS